MRIAHLVLASLVAVAALACSRGGGAGAPIAVTVTKNGFEPWRIPAKKGEPLVLVFTRTTEQTCATEVVVKPLGIDVPLPLNQPVRIELTPDRTGELKFACAMDMFQGVIDVR